MSFATPISAMDIPSAYPWLVAAVLFDRTLQAVAVGALACLVLVASKKEPTRSRA